MGATTWIAPTEVYHNGQVVVWDVYNTTGDTHPMHIHLANLQVLGKAPLHQRWRA